MLNNAQNINILSAPSILGRKSTIDLGEDLINFVAYHDERRSLAIFYCCSMTCSFFFFVY